MKVLLPVDGSECSDRATDYVIGMIREFGPMQVHVLHVQAPVLHIELLINPTPDVMNRWSRKVGSEVSRSACTLLEKAGVPYTLDILDGEVGETIVRRANEGGFDVIVMGTRGRSSFSNMMVGSVAAKVIYLAGIPVTLVK